jgi:TRAP-type mannitol/chloroaromatic compound transport system permease small subunit
MISRTLHILEKVSFLFHKIGTIFFLNCIVALVTVDVLLRYIFNSPIWGSKEINGLLLIMLFFLSLTYCWEQGKHVRVEVFYSRLKGPWQTGADLITGLAGMVFSGLLAFHYVVDLPYVIRTGESGEELGLPFWPFKIIIALCCALFFLKMLGHFIMSSRRMTRGNS